MDTTQIPELNGLDESIRAAMADIPTPGLSLSVVRGGEIVLARGYGVRDVESKAPVTGDTLFAIGSASKAFATMCLAMLADEGKFDWDRPLKDYVPDFRMYDPVATDRATARDICCHRTGLPRHTFFAMDSRCSRKDMVSRLRYLEPNKDFRSTWQYQNHMLGLAGYVVEVVSGKTWEEMVQERIFGPLGMTNSCFSPIVARTKPDWAEPHKVVDGSVTRITPRELFAECPAGGIYSSPREMANWVLFHLGNGEYRGKRLVSEAQMREMHGRQMLIPDSAETAFLQKWGEIGPGAYGLGWFNETYRGRPMVQHGGGIDGFTTAVMMMPKDQLGLVMVVNGGILPMILSYGIFERLLGLSQTDWLSRGKEIIALFEEQAKAAKAGADARRKPGTQPSHPLDAYVGDFEHPGYGVLSVSRDGDGLKARHHEVSFPLQHVHYDIFGFEYPAFGVPFQMAFHSDYDGNIASVTIPFEPSVKDIVYTRVASKAMTDAAVLEAFAGEYELMGMVMKVTVRGNALVASVPGQGDQELMPYIGDEFKVKAMPIVSVAFKRDASGKVVEATLNQPGGSFTAKRKA